MNSKTSCNDTEITLPDLSPHGRDALNLVEFPLALLADRQSSDLKTLVFNDTVWDKGRNQHVNRRLTITASDRYGLPTALDDEVILGLLQLSRENGFTERRVPFTRYQLLQILDWRDEGKSYRRLETSLKRWLGVTLYYERAWWDQRNQVWADKHFHMLDNLLLYRRGVDRNASDCMSHFTWNQEVFDSFQSGSLKQIDMQLYRSLKLPTSKRLFRFLDKRFYFSSRLTFDLKTFAHEHIGMSRGYDCSQIKRRLQPALDELTRSGFLAPNSDASHFQKIRRGQWDIALQQGSRKPSAEATSSSGEETALIARGVSTRMAKRLAREHAPEYIQRKVEVFDRLVRSKDKRISRNPSGYLVRSIMEDYDEPKGVGDCQANKAPVKHRQARAKFPRIHDKERKQVDAYLSQLSEEDRLEMEEKAISCASPIQAKGLRRAESEGNQDRIAHYRRSMLYSHVRKHLKSLASEKTCD